MIRRLLQSIWFSRWGELVLKRTIIRRLSPRVKLLLAICSGSTLEEELALVPFLCSKDGASIDVGAHFGLYTYHMAKHSREVHAFEPMPRYAESLRRSFPRGVVVHPTALSDHGGESRLRVPLMNPTWSTMEGENKLHQISSEGQIEEFVVPCRRLDDYAFDDVSFVKIDVEGHELAVLRGARALMEKHHPSLLVELEDLHRPGIVAETSAFLAGLGYEGFFLLAGKLHPISSFDPAKHQKAENHGPYGRCGDYVLNFVFVHAQARPKLRPFL